MRIDDTGCVDTVGGGAVEFAAQNEARALLQTGRDGDSYERVYRLHPNEAADLGMVCGGTVKILFQFLAPEEKNITLFSALTEGARAGESCGLVRTLSDGRVTSMACVAFDREVRHASLEDGVLTQPVGDTGRVYIFGGGHVAQRLTPILDFVGFRVTVVEDRADFADRSLFPAAEDTVLTPFTRFREKLDIQSGDAVVVMTRGHQADYEVLRLVLKTDAYYIGCIGSRAKVAVTHKRLLEDGYSEEDFLRIHTPIGLKIGAETPEEIAVSIAAEMIQCRAAR